MKIGHSHGVGTNGLEFQFIWFNKTIAHFTKHIFFSLTYIHTFAGNFLLHTRSFNPCFILTLYYGLGCNSISCIVHTYIPWLLRDLFLKIISLLYLVMNLLRFKVTPISSRFLNRLLIDIGPDRPVCHLCLAYRA
jgi:hypothetical protein